MAGKEVKNDLLENHGRKVALSYIQRLSEAVGSVVQAKEEAWSYAPPKEDSQIATVGIGLDQQFQIPNSKLDSSENLTPRGLYNS